MKRLFVILLLLLPFTWSCSTFRALFPSTITIREAAAKKEEIDRSNNPALKYLILRDLAEKRIRVKDVVVNTVTASNNIDYNFMVIASVPYEKGAVDCYIYSRDMKTIARLVAGKTRIDAVGAFGKFFTLLDESYVKIEILNAKITILEGK